MSKNLKILLIAGVIMAVAGCTLIVYSSHQKPSVIPKTGRYSCRDAEMNVCALSEYAGNFVLQEGGVCSIDSCGTLVKSYNVEHSLFHGDILVLDWLRDKKLKFKVNSDTQITVLEDFGLFEKGQVFNLQESS